MAYAVFGYLLLAKKGFKNAGSWENALSQGPHPLQEVSAWENTRDEDACKVTWHFTAEDARNKLASLYPKFTQAEG